MDTDTIKRRNTEQAAPVARTAGIFLLALITGCVSLEQAPPQTVATQGTEPTVAPATGGSDTKAPAPPVATDQAPKKASPVAPAATKPAAPLDRAMLEKRLRDTPAIGVFTKVALKNQVDDLVDQFRELHQRRGQPTQLRQSYDLLFLKVLSLLQDDDPPLAKTIVASREAIWGVLADPVKFSTL